MRKNKQDIKIIPAVILHVCCSNGQMLGGGVELNRGNFVVLKAPLNALILTVFDLLKIRTVSFLISVVISHRIY